MRTAKFGLLLLCLLPGILQATQSVELTANSSRILPNTTPFTAVTSFRVEFRLHGSWDYTTTQSIFGTSSYSIRILTSNQVNITSWRDAKDCFLTPVAGTDVIVRMQRTPSELRAEAVDAQTGEHLGQSTCALGPPGNPQDGGGIMAMGPVAGRVAYVRVYNTTVPIGTPPENTTCSGNVLSFELEGDGTDCSGNGMHLALAGATYTTTPTHPPVSTFNEWPSALVFRAGKPLPLTSFAFSSTDDASLTYLWQQLAGPATGTFSNRFSPQSSFSAPATGAYRVQLTVKDAFGQTATEEKTVSATATDEQLVVVSPQAPLEKILGPVLLYGKSPWTFGDLAEISTAESIATVALAHPPTLGVEVTGTVSVVNGTGTVAGTGTSFVSELAGTSQVVLTWDTIDGPATGRAILSNWTVQDDTHIDLGNGTPLPTQSGLKLYKMADSVPQWANGHAGNWWTFYDPALAFYRLHFRTGDPVWLERARQFADYNWEWMIDHGYGYRPPPRGAQLLSQFVRALDGHPERFPYLAQFINYYQNNLTFNAPANSPDWDVREAGYMMWFEAIGALADPDPGRHTQYCSYLNTLIPAWNAAQVAGGWWPEHPYLQNSGYPYAPASTGPVVYGQAPWRMALAVRAMEANYEVLADTSDQGCNNPALAVSLLTKITAAVTFLHDYARDSVGRGIYYDVQYATNGQLQSAGPGTVSTTLGSPMVNGIGTSFLTTFDCGSEYIGFVSSRTVYKVAICGNDTSLMLDRPFGSIDETSGLTNSSYSRTVPSRNNCDSLADYCNSEDRNLTRLVCGATAWLFPRTGNAVYRDWADECVSATLGGPASGPTADAAVGQFLTPCAGPGCDGYIGDTIVSLANCGPSIPPPCTPGGNPLANMGKNFAEAFGAPGIDNALAWRLGGVALPEMQTVYVSFHLGGIPGAAKAQVSLTTPNGVTTSGTCTGSPCAVAADGRMGALVSQIRYLTAGDALLAVSDPVTVRTR